MSYGYVSHYVQEELSESDCQSDGQQITTDITELYRRKRQIPNRGYYPGYFEHQSRPPCPCSFTPDQPRYCCYKTAPPPSQEAMFRSSTHLPKNQAGGGPPKKYPVTARTPRYYRCATAPLCKRPSTLCLPVTCQLDPAAAAAAAVHRPRKTDVPRYKGQESDYVTKTTKKPEVDSEGDVNSKLNDLENLLTKYDDDEDDEDLDAGDIGCVSELAKILKPRLPPSVKAKQEKIVKLKAFKAANVEAVNLGQNTSKLQVKEAPNEPLDVLLQRLSHEDKEAEEIREENKEGVRKKTPRMKFTETRIRPMRGFGPKPSLDDNSALELHKSKSYIVSLIDKALSRELGTIPGDKCMKKEFLSMSPKRAIDLVNRHSPKTAYNRTVSVDVAQTSTLKKEPNCECRTEEPLYLKQLKQLRWSHLRHIQREAKRLADLERFLDSFGEIDSGP